MHGLDYYQFYFVNQLIIFVFSWNNIDSSLTINFIAVDIKSFSKPRIDVESLYFGIVFITRK